MRANGRPRPSRGERHAGRRVAAASAVLVLLAVTAAGCGARGPAEVLDDDPVDAAPPPATDDEVADPPAPDPPAPDDAADEAPEVPAAAPDVFAAPVRAAWVHLFDDTLKDRASIEAMIDELTTAGVDTLIAQPIRRHDAYHRSDVLPRTADPAVADGFDVLAELLEVAAAADIDVHAWLSVAPTDHPAYADLAAPPGWLATTHGRAAPEADRWVTRHRDGTWSEFLEVALPEVRDHVVDVVTEIARDYPVAGIHLDYVRAPSADHGYHPRSLAAFRDEVGGDGTPAPDDPAFVAWRQQQGTALVAAVRAALDDLDRPVALSAAVITWGDGPGGPSTPDFAATRAAREALQDWPTWVAEGLVDAVLPMNYFREHDAQQAAWYTRWLAYEAELAAEHDVAVVPGIGAWLNAPAAVVDQTRRAVQATDGAAIYSVQEPSDGDRDATWRALARDAWPAS